MGRDALSSRRLPFRTRTVRGEPYHVEGRTLVPVARIVSFGQAKGTIGSDRVSGRGAGFVFTIPVAIEMQVADDKQRIAIRDRTTMVLRGLFGLAVVMTVLLATIRCLGHRKRGAGAE